MVTGLLARALDRSTLPGQIGEVPEVVAVLRMLEPVPPGLCWPPVEAEAVALSHPLTRDHLMLGGEAAAVVQETVDPAISAALPSGNPR